MTAKTMTMAECNRIQAGHIAKLTARVVELEAAICEHKRQTNAIEESLSTADKILWDALETRAPAELEGDLKERLQENSHE